jgi:hypothetical protein
MIYLTDNEIAVDNLRDASSLITILTSQQYVVMVSREENLYIINYIYSRNCNRNNVVFQSREIVEEKLFNESK